MSFTIGHWRLTMIIRVRNVDRPARPRTAGRPAPAEGELRRTMRHQAAEADQARWWADAYLCSRVRSSR
jgi:hypothetical protein